MPNRFIATVLAAAVALTTLASAPARAADNGEIARFVFGAGALLMLGTALSNNNKNRHVNRRYVEPTYNDQPRRHDNVRPRRLMVVPSACLRVNRAGQGPRRFFGRRCLRNNMQNFSALPRQCKRQIWTNRGNRIVFGARCLRNNGWVFG